MDLSFCPGRGVPIRVSGCLSPVYLHTHGSVTDTGDVRKPLEEGTDVKVTGRNVVLAPVVRPPVVQLVRPNPTPVLRRPPTQRRGKHSTDPGRKSGTQRRRSSLCTRRLRVGNVSCRREVDPTPVVLKLDLTRLRST